MPQLSLYFDEPTLKLVGQAAKLSNTSISRWVKKAVIESLNTEWPEGYFNLCGSIKDDSFDIPAEPEMINSTLREEL